MLQLESKGRPAAIEVVRSTPGRGCRKDPMPIGAVVIRKDGPGRTRYVKVRNDGPMQKRWVQYSRWWWERNRGPVPAGKIVVHVDGDRMNDRPDNFALGTHAHHLKVKHRRDPAWSKEQHRQAAAACGDWNRFAGKLRRLRQPITWWYPVVDRLRIAIDVPFRRRKTLLAWFGADVERFPKNGHGRAIARLGESIGVRAVRGRDLGEMARVHPEFKVGAGREMRTAELAEDLEARQAVLMTSEIWSRAIEAARLDSRERK